MKSRAISLCTLFGLLLAGPGEGQTFFTEVTEEAGIVPAWGSRSALFGDYDHDGWPDLFRPWGQATLYHNEGNGHFTDHTRAIQSELTPTFRGGGSIFGDYDNDGDLDLFVPVGAYFAADQNILLRNDRGIFRDVALEAGLTDSLATDNAVWFDYDRDGYLDLYTGNLGCGTPEQPIFNLLYRNRGDGSFEDVTERAGLGLQLGSTEAGGCGGGSNGGMAAGDFNGDGWPDLYIAVFRAPNRLFLNDGQGHFRDATTNEIGDPGEAFGVGVGDTDNDGDLDIFQTGGGNDDLKLPYRSPLLLNLGQGQFLDVTEGVGLGGMVGQNLLIGTLGDIDNDGDLDLLTGFPHFLYLNNGDGTFVDQTAQSGITTAYVVAPFGFGDYDLDGFLDAWDGPRLFHNNGKGNHYLRVELVGVKSNRSGIGARVIATSGDLRQMREVLGGYGYNQDELVAHFGLGPRTQVDRLEIRWPSGQVDVFTDIPADQKIRVFEGRAGYQVVKPSVWTAALPDSLVAGKSFSGVLAVRPALFEEGARITRVVADLSELGGPEAAPLQEAGDGTWQLETTLQVSEAHGYRTVSVVIDQQTSLGPYWTELSHPLLVLPAKDQAVSAEGLAGDWHLGPAETGTEEKLGFAGIWDGVVNLFLVNADGTNQVLLTHSDKNIVVRENFGLYNHNLAWSPDGRQIVVAAALDGPRALYVMAADGTQLRQLTFPAADRFDWTPSWSPDGKKIAFASNRDGDPQIYAMDADGSNLVKLTDYPAIDQGNPSWSPDGSKIAFDTNRDEPNGADIYVMEADGSNPVNLTKAPGADFNPSWSPDGKRIVFVTNRNAGTFELYVMDTDGSNQTLLPGTENCFTPSWSPDGTRIAFRGGMISGLEGSGPVQVTWNPAFWAIPNWLPKGVPSPVQVLNTETSSVNYQGRQARQLRAERLWMTSYQPVDPVVPTGYAALGFAFHPGDAQLPEEGWLKVLVNDKHLDLLSRVELGRKEWQEVEIPLEEFALNRPIEQIQFSGLLQGTFYLADIRLVTAASRVPLTVVEEERSASLPQSFSLSQNYPNPFNSQTVIRFELPRSGEVELAVFNLAGQQVAKLVEGVREAGTYTVRWDGRDERGRELASGVYLYRLRAGDRMETRKLVLVR